MNDFDEKAREWDQNRMHLERTKSVARAMLDQIAVTPSMNALEFGAGTGLLSFFLKDLFAGITLMDTSAEMLKMAETKLTTGDHGKVKTLFFDLEKAAYTGEQFDIIFTQMVLHHIKDVDSILEKFYQMLRPGGFVAIADLNTEDGSFHDPGVEVHHGFDPGNLSNRLEEVGFGEIACNQCFVIRKETGEGKTLEYPVFLLTAKKQL
ncbi:MAG: class I SAM-dependent methyltransferase [Bacteroidetes bacterium]|nr:class I SAM-dependent methyltransferase [Bacteroidota bacterium]